MVTANLPPFASPGSRMDVSVSSLGDATSLRGGTLVMTASAHGSRWPVYAVAQVLGSSLAFLQTATPHS